MLITLVTKLTINNKITNVVNALNVNHISESFTLMDHHQHLQDLA